MHMGTRLLTALPAQMNCDHARKAGAEVVLSAHVAGHLGEVSWSDDSLHDFAGMLCSQATIEVHELFQRAECEMHVPLIAMQDTWVRCPVT